MSILPDHKIKDWIDIGVIGVEPYDESNVEPASMDLRLGDSFKYPRRQFQNIPVDLDNPSQHKLKHEEVDGDEITLNPGEFVLASTKEYIELPPFVSAEVLGRSSLGRLGISVHQTAGYIDPGFEGEVTLELSNHGVAPVKLREGMRTCQIIFHNLRSPSEEPYGHEGSQYQGQTGATESGMRFD